VELPIIPALRDSLVHLDDFEVLQIWRRKSEPEATDLLRHQLNRLGRPNGWHAVRELTTPGASRLDIGFVRDSDWTPFGVIEAKAAYSADVVLGFWASGTRDHGAFLQDLDKLRRARKATGARSWALLWLPHWIWMTGPARTRSFFPYQRLVRNVPHDRVTAEHGPTRTGAGGSFDGATELVVAEFHRLGLRAIEVADVREAHVDGLGRVPNVMRATG
jgi:hypothetical protein